MVIRYKESLLYFFSHCMLYTEHMNDCINIYITK